MIINQEKRTRLKEEDLNDLAKIIYTDKEFYLIKKVKEPNGKGKTTKVVLKFPNDKENWAIFKSKFFENVK